MLLSIVSLVYLTVTRPDIAHAVHLVSQFLAAPHSTHYAAVIHILRYIKGTMFHGLHFSTYSTLDLCVYSDADWAGDPTDRRSTTGFCFFLGDSLIFWRNKKQYIVSCSSTEVEYRALVDTTSELLALLWLLEDMGLTHSSPTVIHCDNCSAIQIAHNDVFHERIKHIEIILCVIICLLASCVFFQLTYLIRLLISLLRPFLLIVFVILFPNSR